MAVGVMAGNKKPRKKYRPREKVALPMVFRHDGHEDLMLKLIPHTELDKLRDGTADKYTVNTLAFRINLGLVMANEVFKDTEARDVMLAGLEAVRGVKARMARAGKWGCSGKEFRAMGDALNLTDEMQAATTRRQQAEALRIMLALNELKQKGVLDEAQVSG